MNNRNHNPTNVSEKPGSKGYWRLVLALAWVLCPLAPTPVDAGDLKDFVSDLWGGDGIFLADAGPPFSHAPHFRVASLQGLDELSSALTGNIGFNSFNSVVTGFTLDLETGEPVRTTDSLGPLLAESATTLGEHKLNVGVSFTRSKFDRFEGQPIDNLSLTLDHEDSNEDGVLGPPPPVFDFELDTILVDLDLEITQDVLAVFVNYGVTSNWDVGVIVPIIYMRVEANGFARLIDNSATTDLHEFDVTAGSDNQRSRVKRSKTGIGDVVLRTKYNFVRGVEDMPDMAVSGLLVLPTGDQDDLMGTGETRIQANLLVSKAIKWITPHANIGYEWAPNDSDFNSLRYIVGVDMTPNAVITLATDVLGRWEHSGNGMGDHIVDLAFGVKWNVLKTTLVNWNFRFPLNENEGLRADVVWAVGVEHTY